MGPNNFQEQFGSLTEFMDSQITAPMLFKLLLKLRLFGKSLLSVTIILDKYGPLLSVVYLYKFLA